MKRLLAVFLAALMVAACSGCKGKDNASSSSAPVSLAVSSAEPQKTTLVNPLTGVEDMKKDAVLLKPVAIMINNIETAWGVQASLSKADIVYETYVEGGITRLMAVFKDLRTVGSNKIGSLRSGRYSYVDLAVGQGAQYVHAGLDEKYCGPHIAEVGTTTVDLNTTADRTNIKGGNSCATRISNGLAYEHTLYTTGNELNKMLKDSVGLKLKKAQDNWMNFVAEDKKYTPADGTCNELFVPFSGSYSAEFKFDSKTGVYNKYRYGEKQKDYNDGKAVSFGNVLVLYSNVYTFADGKHVQTDLSSGSGYYVSNGGYRKINWKKGSAASALKITDDNGNDIEYNPGNTYVCFTNNSNKSSTVIK